MNRSLLIMAGGMGSRYGGLKQVDSFGPNNESILDYSIFDAIKAGFNKIVILSSPKLKKYFEDKYIKLFHSFNNISLEIVVQEPIYGLKQFTLPDNRVKPWGTAHAILCCENVINESFITINADDFYGYGAFKKAIDSLSYIEKNNLNVSTISYLIENTLSENGGVSRGVCIKDGKKLITIEETHDLVRRGDIVEGKCKAILDWGAFIDLNGADALLHVTDLSYSRVKKTSDLLSVGQTIKCKIIKIDNDTKRISLGIKQMHKNPYENLEKKYKLNKIYKGIVTKCVDYGAFVKLEEGLEGLVHQSELSWTKKTIQPSKVLSPSQEINIKIIEKQFKFNFS